MNSRLINRLAAQTQVYLCLDFDGTVVEKAPTPELVCVDQALLDLLQQLCELKHLQLAVVSGRSLEELRRLLPLEERVALVGSHGGEILIPGKGLQQEPVPAGLPEALTRLAARFEPRLAAWSGCLLETKPVGLALHYRQASRQDSELAARAFAGMATPLLETQAMELLRGDEVIELRRRGIDKGSAVRYLLRQADKPGSHPVFFGDDRTDEDAFSVIAGTGTTVFVGIRNNHTETDFRLDGPTQVRAVLRDAFLHYPDSISNSRTILERGK